MKQPPNRRPHSRRPYGMSMRTAHDITMSITKASMTSWKRPTLHKITWFAPIRPWKKRYVTM